MPDNQRGYDIESFDPVAKRTRRIEIKGLSGAWKDGATVSMTAPQFDDGRGNEEEGVDYWLYVVDCLGAPSQRVLPIPRAAARVERFYFQAMDWEGEVVATEPLDPGVEVGVEIPEEEPA